MRKSILSLMIAFAMIIGFQICTFALTESDIESYQGIFMKDNIFLSIPLYTDWEPGSTAIGVVYQINTPKVDGYGYVNGDFIDTLGELHKQSNKNYYIQGDSGEYRIVFREKSISIYNINGSTNSYTGDYIQVSNAGANMNPSSIWLNIPQRIKVELNGTNLTFDQSPIIINDRVMVPVRTIFEAMGYTVRWSQYNQTATASNGINNITVQINNSTINYTGGTYYCDVVPQIVSGRTLVPIRAIAESAGCSVKWDSADQKVIIIK